MVRLPEAKKAKAKPKAAKPGPVFEDRQYDGPSPVPHEDEAQRRQFRFDFDQDQAFGESPIDSDEMVNGEANVRMLSGFSFLAGNTRR